MDEWGKVMHYYKTQVQNKIFVPWNSLPIFDSFHTEMKIFAKRIVWHVFGIFGILTY